MFCWLSWEFSLKEISMRANQRRIECLCDLNSKIRDDNFVIKVAEFVSINLNSIFDKSYIQKKRSKIAMKKIQIHLQLLIAEYQLLKLR